MEGSFWGRGALTDSERTEAAAQRWQEASSSGTTAERQSRQGGRGWHATGIELAFLGGGKKLETGKEYDMTDKEAHEFNRKNFGQPGMQYEDIFREYPSTDPDVGFGVCCQNIKHLLTYAQWLLSALGKAHALSSLGLFLVNLQSKSNYCPWSLPFKRQS